MYRNLIIRKISFLALLIHLAIILASVNLQAQNERQHALRFAFLTDLHVSPGTPSESNLQKIVTEINTLDIDFTVVTGDISNSGLDTELYAVKHALDRLARPVYVIPGNHETNWSETAGLRFGELWGNDRFSFTSKGYKLMGFDTGPYMKMGDGHVKEEDIAWISRELGKKTDAPLTLIAFAHYPLNEGLDNWDKVTDLLKQHDCKAVFCGHGHRLQLMNFDEIPGVMGRAMSGGRPATIGYNMVEIRNDSILVSEKQLGNPDAKLVYSFNYLHPREILQLAVSPKPDFTINSNYPFIKEYFHVDDTASIFAGPCLANDTLLVYGNSLGWIKGLNNRSGRKYWELTINSPLYSTPVTAGGMICFGTARGKILGINPHDGSLRWEIETGSPVLAEGVEDGNSFYIGTEKGFYKIDPQTGKVTWKYDGIHGLVQGKPVIAGNNVLFGAWDRYLYCLDKSTGNLVWKWDNGKPQSLFSPGNIAPVCSYGKVFIVAPDRYMTAIDLQTGKEVWRTNQFQVRESMGISRDGKLVFAKLMNDSILAVEAKPETFTPAFAVNAGMGYEHSPCPLAADKHTLYASTRNGVLIAIDLATPKVTWKYKAGNSSANKMLLGKDNHLWVTLVEGKIVSLGPVN